MSVGATLYQGAAQAAALEGEAAQQEAQANQERAVAQYNAAKQREEHKRVLARQRAGLAASGFDPTDATGTVLTAETVKTATLEELLTLAQGEERARQMDFAAKVRSSTAKSARRGSYLAAGATLAGGLYDIGQSIPRGSSKPVPK